MARQLFGTDGIRGVAGQAPLSALDVLRLGAALAAHFAPAEGHSGSAWKVVVGRDTRRSGPMLEAALCAGLSAAGAEVLRVGVLPTPAVAFLTRAVGACAGVVISASHNPFEDNGIKIFGHDGFKLSDEEELDLEHRLSQGLLGSPFLEQAGSAVMADRAGLEIGLIHDMPDAEERYLTHLQRSIPETFSLEGCRLVIDAAHGAAASTGTRLFRSLGAEVIELASSPDGQNINHACGALHPQRLQAKVLELKAQFGIALDGDADRVIMVDDSGTIRNGDHLMALFARTLKEQGALPQNTLVATQMSNLGLERFVGDHGISLIRTGVGDRYVMEVLRQEGHPLGGEQSGHLLLMSHSTTGDGLLAALQAIWILMGSRRTFAQALRGFEEYPQILLNTRLQQRRPLTELPDVQRAIAAAEAELGAEGRILVRFSGTEPLARVMLEGRDLDQIRRLGEHIRDEIAQALGAPSA